MTPGESARWQVSTDSGNGVRWRPDGRELFFMSGASWVSVAVDAGPSFRAATPRAMFEAPVALRTATSQYAQGFDVTADGQKFLATRPSPQVASAAIHVILNWQAQLPR